MYTHLLFKMSVFHVKFRRRRHIIINIGVCFVAVKKVVAILREKGI